MDIASNERFAPVLSVKTLYRVAHQSVSNELEHSPGPMTQVLYFFLNLSLGACSLLKQKNDVRVSH